MSYITQIMDKQMKRERTVGMETGVTWRALKHYECFILFVFKPQTPCVLAPAETFLLRSISLPRLLRTFDALWGSGYLNLKSMYNKNRF